MPKDKGSDGKNVAPGEPVEHHSIFTWLVKPFFTSARLAGSMDSMPMKIHLPPEAAIRSTSSSSRSRLALIWATQCTCALAAMMSRSNDLVRFTLMAKLSSMKNTAIWRPPPARALSAAIVRSPRFHGTKTDGVAQKIRHGAKFASVGTAAPDSTGIIRKVPQPAPTRLSSGCNMPGSKLNWSSLILSQESPDRTAAMVYALGQSRPLARRHP